MPGRLWSGSRRSSSSRFSSLPNPRLPISLQQRICKLHTLGPREQDLPALILHTAGVLRLHGHNRRLLLRHRHGIHADFRCGHLDSAVLLVGFELGLRVGVELDETCFDGLEDFVDDGGRDAGEEGFDLRVGDDVSAAVLLFVGGFVGYVVDYTSY